jgi:hypothetical protein
LQGSGYIICLSGIVTGIQGYVAPRGHHPLEEKPCAQDTEFSAVLQMLGLSFPECCLTSAKDTWPFNESQIFILLLQLNIVHFYLAIWTPFALGEAISSQTTQ